MLSVQGKPRIAVVRDKGQTVATMLIQNKFGPNGTLIAAEFSSSFTSDAGGVSLCITGNEIL